MSTPTLKDRIRKEAKRMGFDRVGFARAGPCRDRERLENWLSEGRHGEMKWMERALDLSGCTNTAFVITKSLTEGHDYTEFQAAWS